MLAGRCSTVRLGRSPAPRDIVLPRRRPSELRRRIPGRVNGYSLDDLFEEYAEREGLEYHEKRTKNDPTKSEYDYANLQQFWPSGDDDSGWVDVPPYNEGPEPGKGPVEKQVGMTLEEALRTDAVDPTHTAYWFTEPPGGWQTENKRMRPEPVHPGFFATSKNPEAGRPSILDLKPGDVFYGIVTEMWLYHGIKVDIGFDHDGLLPMYEQTWKTFGDTLDIGKAVKVEVVKIWKHDIYRWPVQLTALDPRIRRFEIPAKHWDPPIDYRGKSLAEIEKYTNRRLPTQKCFLPDEGFATQFSFQKEAEEKETGMDQKDWDKIQEHFFWEMEDIMQTVDWSLL